MFKKAPSLVGKGRGKSAIANLCLGSKEEKVIKTVEQVDRLKRGKGGYTERKMHELCIKG